MNRYVQYREGQVAWVDLTTSDLSRSATFYAELFGWDIDDLGPEAGGYRMATVATQPVAGLLQASPAHPLESWSVYLAVDDIDDACERAERAGAQLLVPPYALDAQGRYALLADPGGAVVGLWQGAAHHGTQIHSFAGSPGWFEIHTKRYDEACRFYGEAFGLTIEPLAEDDGFRYSTARLTDGAAPAFGIFDVSTSRPSSVASTWTVYFLTADADRDVERAVSLGARLTFGPEDSVYGRMATFIDPQGAAFNLIEPPLPEPAQGAAAPVAIDVADATGGERETPTEGQVPGVEAIGEPAEAGAAEAQAPGAAPAGAGAAEVDAASAGEDGAAVAGAGAGEAAAGSAEAAGAEADDTGAAGAEPAEAVAAPGEPAGAAPAVVEPINVEPTNADFIDAEPIGMEPPAADAGEDDDASTGEARRRP